MKKQLVSLIILSTFFITTPSAMSNEIVEDYMDIATSYAVSGNYASSMDYINKILAIEPSNKDIQSLKNSLTQMMNGNISSPMASTNKNIMQAQSAKRAGNTTAEMQLLTQAAANGGYWANVFAGDYYRKTGQYSKAITFYQKALNSTTQFSAPLLYLGICYFEMKNYNEAFPLLTQFIAHNQQESYAYAMRARVLVEMGRCNDAETDIVTALALEDTIEYRYLEGLILFKRGNYKKAQTSLEKIANKIQNSDVYKFLGLSYYATGDLNNALLNLDKALLLSDDDKALQSTYNEVKAKLLKGQNNG